MSLSNQDYADIAEDSYRSYPPGRRQEGNEERVVLNGQRYKILEHVDNHFNGYQGTIYQRIDIGEIVVAHRGTEFDREPIKDGVLVDGGMAAARTNAQINDAIELTRRATEYAERMVQKYGYVPQVTVVGHSLGGCLAQVTAYKFDLKGETFNAYGAVSLNQGVTSGGNSVINHVMAGDAVSSASPHFGGVQVYSTPAEIKTLTDVGYENNRKQLDLRAPGAAAVLLGDSHRIHNFLAVDGKDKPDRSILADPQARQLTQQYGYMIEKYRDDIGGARNVATFLARGPYGHMQDAIDGWRSPLPPGELVRQQDRQDAALGWQESRGVADVKQILPSRENNYVPEVVKPGGGVSLPDYALPLDERTRPPLKKDETAPYKGMPLSGVMPDQPDYRLDSELKQVLPTGTSEERLAQITVAAKIGGVRAGQLDGVHIDEQSMQIFVSGKVPGNRCCVDLATPPPSLQETFQRSEAFDLQQAQRFAQFQAQQQSINEQNQGGLGMKLG